MVESVRSGCTAGGQMPAVLHTGQLARRSCTTEGVHAGSPACLAPTLQQASSHPAAQAAAAAAAATLQQQGSTTGNAGDQGRRAHLGRRGWWA